jgi:transposase InsO family protein
VAIDDCSRIAHTKIQDSEAADAAVDYLLAAVRYYRSLGITIRRVLTDNGACYRSKKSAAMCRCPGSRHRVTRPYTPRTNGKTERSIQTALREWAYAFAYSNSEERGEQLPRWLHDYNWYRQYGSLNLKTPISTPRLSGDSLVRLHISPTIATRAAPLPTTSAELSTASS